MYNLCSEYIHILFEIIIHFEKSEVDTSALTNI